MERHEALEEGVMRQGAEGRSMFQLYRGSREAKGSQMLSVARECLGIFFFNLEKEELWELLGRDTGAEKEWSVVPLERVMS